jgi:hypothetical protein
MGCGTADGLGDDFGGVKGPVSTDVIGICLDNGSRSLMDRGVTMCCSRPSPLDTLDTTFRLLTGGPPPLTLHGRTIGLRRESIGLLDVRAMMFHPATTAPVQRAALGELVRRARRHRGQWVVGLAGVLLPGLRGSPAGRTPDCSASAADFGVMMLASLLQQLDAPGVPSEEIAEGLLWTVVRSPDEPALERGDRTRLVVVGRAL